MRQSPRMPALVVAGWTSREAAWGHVEVSWTAMGLCGLDLGGPPARLMAAPLPSAWGPQLQACLAGDLAAARAIPVDLTGCTPFVQHVLGVLREVPPHALWTYGQLAAACGCRSSQAIGQAIGANPIPWVIPCHRIIAAGPRLGGFSSGLQVKARLLRLEHPRAGSLPPAIEAAVTALLA